MKDEFREKCIFWFTILWTVLVAFLLVKLFGGWANLTLATAILLAVLTGVFGPVPGFILGVNLYSLCFPRQVAADEKRWFDSHLREQELAAASHIKWTLDSVEEVIHNGDRAKVNTEDFWRNRMIECVIEANLHEMVEELIELGAELNYCSRQDTYSPLCCAAEHCDEKMIDLLCAHGARVNEKLRFSWTNGYMGDSWGRGFTALHFAAKAGNLPAVRALIKNGAQVNATTDYLEQTPLFKAVDFIVASDQKLLRQEEVVNYLLDHGADPKIDSMSDNNFPDLNRMPQLARKHNFPRLLQALGISRNTEEPFNED